MNNLKKLCIIFAALLCAGATALAVYAGVAVNPNNEVYDVNGDDTIDSRDLVVLMKSIANARTDYESGSYDMNGDGSVNSIDLVRLMKYIAVDHSSDKVPPVTTYDPDSPEGEVEAMCIQHKATLSLIADRLPGIVCWGDSLTSGPGQGRMSYPLALQNKINENICGAYDPTTILSDEAKALINAEDYTLSIPVVNMGVGGETTNTILGRSGAVPFLTTKDFTIPAEVKWVFISNLISQNGNSVLPLLQGNAGMEYVTINGIKGEISGGQGGYFFRRYTAGEAVQVPAGTVVVTPGSENYRDYVTVIFIGQNGGYIGFDNLVQQQRSIIEHQTNNNDRYIIIGMHMTTPSYREDLETLMVEEFGDKYINLRNYMATEAIYDAGLTPTDQDLKRMQSGWTPFSLLESDQLHFNATGYELIGNLVYERMIELGYFDEAMSAIGIS